MTGNLRRNAVTMTDVLVVAVTVIGLVVSVLPRLADQTREDANRVRCADNLRQIGQAILRYSKAERRTGAFPRTVYDPASAQKPAFFTHAEAADPFGVGGPVADDVTASIWLLVRTQQLTPALFICPSTPMRSVDIPPGKTGKDFSNFASSKNLSYSLQNPFATKAVANLGYTYNDSLPSDFALMADMNPGGLEVIAVDEHASVVRQQQANSPNHGGDGQNVLYPDGNVTWQPTSFAGSQDVHGQRDSIYTYTIARDGQTSNDAAGVTGPPGGPFDSVLLPVWDKTIPRPTIDRQSPTTSR